MSSPTHKSPEKEAPKPQAHAIPAPSMVPLPEKTAAQPEPAKPTAPPKPRHDAAAMDKQRELIAADQAKLDHDTAELDRMINAANRAAKA